MGETTHISWADHTFNPWIGCMKVSPACDGCYAEHLMDTRMHRVAWGAPGHGAGERERTSPANWREPLAWDRAAAKAGTRPFVFCASLADVFDNAVPTAWRADLFDLIRATPNLVWLLLTKRPVNIVSLFREQLSAIDRALLADPPVRDVADCWPFNAAIGCTVVNQEEADRDIHLLLAAKDQLRPAFAFLSMEPLLGPVDIAWAISWRRHEIAAGLRHRGRIAPGPQHIGVVDWVITGGETDQGAHKARPSHPDWFRCLRDQCATAGVPFHHKQNGEWMHRPEMIDARGSSFHRFGDGAWMERVGKTRAGRALDGVIHDARPGSRP